MGDIYCHIREGRVSFANVHVCSIRRHLFITSESGMSGVQTVGSSHPRFDMMFRFVELPRGSYC